MRILIAGASGAIGRPLVRRLRACAATCCKVPDSGMPPARGWRTSPSRIVHPDLWGEVK